MEVECQTNIPTNGIYQIVKCGCVYLILRKGNIRSARKDQQWDSKNIGFSNPKAHELSRCIPSSDGREINKSLRTKTEVFIFISHSQNGIYY
ncbi:MAG: hypothetical protein ACJAQ4_002369 [Cryomorphaceae bacterium]|jgi:hypothetical protein